MSTDVSQEHVASSFACCLFHAASLLGLLFNTDGGGQRSSEILVDFQRTTGRYNQKIELFITTAMRTSNQNSIRLDFSMTNTAYNYALLLLYACKFETNL
jgi:hypothetical protein